MKHLRLNFKLTFVGVLTFTSILFLTSMKVRNKEKTTTPPSKEFLKKIKETNKCTKSIYKTHCYDLSEIEFEDYENINYNNILTTYRSILDLSEHDEIVLVREQNETKTRFRKERHIKYYNHTHKSFYVLNDYTLEPNEIQIDSSFGNINTIKGYITPNLNVDTSQLFTENLVFNNIIDKVKLNEYEQFSWIAWNNADKNNIADVWKPFLHRPIGQKVIFKGEIVYLYPILKVSHRLETILVLASAKTGQLLKIHETQQNHLLPENAPEFYAPSSTSEIKYSIENPILTGTNNEYLEFDIDVSSLLNSEKFFKGEIYLSYNSLTFGTNLAASGRITLTKGTVLSLPNYTINVIDVNTDQIKITAQSTPTNPNNYFTLTNQSDELAHVKIDISNLVGNTDIEFEELQMQGLSEFFNMTTGNTEPFETVTANDELDIDINSIVLNSCSYCNGNVLNNISCNPDTSCNCSSFMPISPHVSTLYYDCQNINVDSCDTGGMISVKSHKLQENIETWDISSFDPNVMPATPPVPVKWCIGYTIILDERQQSEANAMFSMLSTNDYYSTPSKININSYDNLGTTIYLFLHAKGIINGSLQQSSTAHWGSTIPLNATFPLQYGKGMELGDGEIGKCNPMVSLDIIAHEYTHGVLNKYFDLNSNFLGDTTRFITNNALHESLCDIFSVLIRYEEFGTIDWSIGNESCFNHSSLPRYVNNPNSSKIIQASYYKDNNYGWLPDTISSGTIFDKKKPLYYNYGGVISNWFYLLSEGGTGAKGDAVSAIGIDVAENILIQTLEFMRVDLTGATQYTFEEFRDFSLSASSLIHGSCSQEHISVAEAWKAVGLITCDSFEVDFTVQPNPADTCKPWMIVTMSGGSQCYNIQWYQKDNLSNWVPISTNYQFQAGDCGFEYRVSVSDTVLSCVFNEWETTNTTNLFENQFNFQVRPNISESKVFLDFEVTEKTNLSIKVFDQLGRLVSEPIRKEDFIFGNYSIEYNASSLVNGLYFITLDTGQKRVTKKFVKI